MKKYLLLSFSGLITTFIGLGVAIVAIETKAAVWMIWTGFGLIPVGGGILFLAVKKSSSAFLTREMKFTPGVIDTGFEEDLKKKNELVNDYKKTSQTRDQLRVLQVSSAAEKKQ